MAVRDIFSQMVEGEKPSLDDISAKKEELMEMGSTLIELYESDIEKIIKNDAYIVILITVAYCIAVLILYFLVYVRSLNNIQKEITNIWSLGRLIPIDHRNKIMRALKAHTKIALKKS